MVVLLDDMIKSAQVYLTVTSLKKLSKEERVEEIAQMLGGKELSASAIAHANQLLN